MFFCFLKVSCHHFTWGDSHNWALQGYLGFASIPSKPGERCLKFSKHSETFQLSLNPKQIELLWQEQMYLAFLPWTVSTTAANLALMQSVLFETYVVIFLQKKHSTQWAEVTQIHWAAKQGSNFSSFLYDGKRKLFLKLCGLTAEHFHVLTSLILSVTTVFTLSLLEYFRNQMSMERKKCILFVAIFNGTTWTVKISLMYRLVT